MVECYGKGVKYSLLAANLIMFICGLVVLTCGIWTVSDRSFVERLLGVNFYIVSSVLLIIVGTIVALISFLGFLGAYKEVNCMLKVYFIILFSLLILIASIGMLCFLFKSELDDKVQSELIESIKHYGNDSRVTEAWDSLQTTFQCCGISVKSAKGWEIWRKESTKFNSNDGPQVPVSCCRSREDDQLRRQCLSRMPPKKEDTYLEGCYETMKSAVVGHATSIGIVSVGVMSFISFGLILSGTLFLILKSKKLTTQKPSTDISISNEQL